MHRSDLYAVQFHEPLATQFSVRRAGRLAQIRVHNVQRNSEADHAGVAEGHFLLRVHTIAVSGMRLPLVRNLLLADPPVLVEFATSFPAEPPPRAEQQRDITHLPHPRVRTNWAGWRANCTRSFTLDEYRGIIPLLLDENPCEYCGFVFFRCETKLRKRHLCCGDGLATSPNDFPDCAALPVELRDLYTHFTPALSSKSYRLNNCFQLSSIQSEPSRERGGQGWVERGGFGRERSMTIHGRIFHAIRDAGAAGAVNWFVHDGGEAQQAENGAQLGLSAPLVRRIRGCLLRSNPYVHSLSRLQGLADQLEPVGLRIAGAHSEHSVGAIFTHGARAGRGEWARNTTRAVVFWRIGPNQRSTCESVPATSAQYEPLSYPLFFPRGEDGWSIDFRTSSGERLTLVQYVRMKVLRPEDLYCPNAAGEMLRVNRFQLLGRLFQVYLVDMWSRALDQQLAFLERNQHQFLRGNHGGENGDAHDGGQPDVDEGQQDSADGIAEAGVNDTSRRVFLPSSFKPGPRYRRTLCSNALTLWARCGKPTFFVTATTNPHWPEITRQLCVGQTAYDRPDVTCRVFHCKLAMLLEAIRGGFIFGPLHEVQYEIRVIEFQKRGLPHCHIVVQLSEVPANTQQLLPWIDAHISAEIPVALQESDNEDDQRYLRLVKKHMIHKCSRGANGCLSTHQAVEQCSAHFPQPVTNATFMDERGYVHYRRRTNADAKVVAHNRKLLLLFNGHVNIEFSGTVNLIMYLYKYIFKGPDQCRYTLITTQQTEPNEARNYINGRYLSSMEAMWSLLGLQTYPASHPAVLEVKVHLWDQWSRQQVAAGKFSDLMCYFKRPASLRTLKYTEMYERFTVKKQGGSGALSVTENGHTLYYCPRRSRAFVRMNILYPTIGDLWYLRLLLLHVAARNYDELREVNHQRYHSYQEAARARGLLDVQNEADLAMDECQRLGTPDQLRTLFVLLTVQGFATAHMLRHDHETWRWLCADYLDQDPLHNQRQAHHRLLEDIQRRLAEQGQTMSKYGLPEVRTSIPREVDREREFFNTQSQFTWLQAQPHPTTEQQHIINRVLHALQEQETLLLFIHGFGGCGKTWLIRYILASIRAQGKLAAVCAPTALAASNYERGHTAHALFKIPILEEDDQSMLESSIRPNSERLEFLTALDCICWDELPNQGREVVELALETMNGMHGKVLVAAGDFRQIAPVVRNGTRAEIVSASMRASPLWDNFEICQLTQPLRAQDDAAFAQWTLAIGEQRIAALDYVADLGAAAISLMGLRVFTNQQLDAAISFTFPNLRHPAENAKSAILASTNEAVGRWNVEIQRRVEGDAITLLSVDRLADADDPANATMVSVLSEEVLHAFTSPDVPPHSLQLKVGDICLIMRNLARQPALVNNARVIVRTIRAYTVTVQLLSTTPALNNSLHVIPRIYFRFRPQGSCFCILRKQFPLRLAYAVTVNRSQGQELARVLYDVDESAFTHGQCYVALSRVRKREHIAVFVSEPDQLMDGQPVTVNVVYPELLR